VIEEACVLRIASTKSQKLLSQSCRLIYSTLGTSRTRTKAHSPAWQVIVFPRIPGSRKIQENCKRTVFESPENPAPFAQYLWDQEWCT